MGGLLGKLVAQSIGGLACWQVDGLSSCGQLVACGSVACEVGGLPPWLGGPWLPWLAGPASCKTLGLEGSLGLEAWPFCRKGPCSVSVFLFIC
jgi:hypothetical protein